MLGGCCVEVGGSKELEGKLEKYETVSISCEVMELHFVCKCCSAQVQYFMVIKTTFQKRQCSLLCCTVQF